MQKTYAAGGALRDSGNIPECATFVRTILGLSTGCDMTFVPVGRGGSDREYFRVAIPGHDSFILMRYGRLREENNYYAAIAGFLREIGVAVPAVFGHDPKRGLLLMEDLGDEDLFGYRNAPWDHRRRLYEKTLTLVSRLHAFPPVCFPTGKIRLMPGFGAELYRWERDYFREQCVTKVCGIRLTQEENEALETELKTLARRLLETPPALIHRDLQSQNVMVRKGETILIDFQGMRFGNLFYDLGSLLYDPYVEFRDADRNALLRIYYDLSRPLQGWDEFEELFYLASAQRLMQALGAYGFLGREQGKTRFFVHIGPALDHLIDVTGRAGTLPRLHALARLCGAALQPLSALVTEALGVVNPMKVLVTGATGFLGSSLVKALAARGDAVRALSRGTDAETRLSGTGVEIVRGDMKDRDSLRRAIAGVDAVCHTAAAMKGAWREHQETTIRGTQWLLELAREAGVKRFVHISSITVYRTADLRKGTLVDETSSLDPDPRRLGPYAHAKIEAERQVFRFLGQGLPAVVIRPGNIYGPGGRVIHPNVGYFITKHLFLLVGGDHPLPLTYLDNTVDGILLALSSDRSAGQVFNLVDGVEITQRTFLDRYRTAVGGRFVTLSVPLPLLLAAAAPARFLTRIGVRLIETPVYGFRAQYANVRFDAMKARRELGWQPLITLDQGLDRTFSGLPLGADRPISR